MSDKIEACICGGEANIVKEPTDHSEFGVCCGSCGLMFVDNYGDCDVVLGWNEIMRGLKARQPAAAAADPAADPEGFEIDEGLFNRLATGILEANGFVDVTGAAEQIKEIMQLYFENKYKYSVLLGRKILEQMAWWGSHGTLGPAEKSAVIFNIVETIIERARDE